jgi:hypothetical protein
MTTCIICKEQVGTKEFNNHVKEVHDMSMSKYLSIDDNTCLMCFKRNKNLKTHKCRQSSVIKPKELQPEEEPESITDMFRASIKHQLSLCSKDDLIEIKKELQRADKQRVRGIKSSFEFTVK